MYKRQVVHGIPNVAGYLVLPGQDVIYAAARPGGVRPRVRIVSGSQHGHKAKTDDAGLPPGSSIIGSIRFLGILKIA